VRARQPQLAEKVLSTPQVQTPAFRRAECITAQLCKGQLRIRRTMSRMAGDVEKREGSTGGEGLKRDTLPFVRKRSQGVKFISP
jgi:hypothetical protein